MTFASPRVCPPECEIGRRQFWLAGRVGWLGRWGVAVCVSATRWRFPDSIRGARCRNGLKVGTDYVSHVGHICGEFVSPEFFLAPNAEMRPPVCVT